MRAHQKYLYAPDEDWTLFLSSKDSLLVSSAIGDQLRRRMSPPDSTLPPRMNELMQQLAAADADKAEGSDKPDSAEPSN